MFGLLDMCTTTEVESPPKLSEFQNPTLHVSSEYASTQSEAVTNVSEDTDFPNSNIEVVKEKSRISYQAIAEVIQLENDAYRAKYGKAESALLMELVSIGEPQSSSSYANVTKKDYAWLTC